ncbi:aminodeoxychorismate lyase [Arthrobacter sp. MYb211]|uniref:endolytic transglycosylase MltG n=1 Tax=Micrococcaceae TaxID=1268 RepID=UPI000CFB377C|nr:MULTISPECIES: endolytic transglycosylase MltG [unclassified Arthrobacter]PRA13809.1 aminodeoxychorismate lyase [Arthrobacter sp. MYb221]PRC09179.1 aminodeoxychorismate lyase [Arthrobacter sp. MYb211]
MREEARRERQRETFSELYARFAAGEPKGLATPTTPELTGEQLYGGADSAAAELHREPEPAMADAEPQPAPESLLGTVPASGAAKARKKRSKRRRNLVMLATFLIFAVVVAGSFYFIRSLVKQFNPDDYPGPGGQAVEFTVEDGWGPALISRKLEELDVVASDKLFMDALEDSKADNVVIHPGTYPLKLQMPAADATEVLVDNRPDKVFYIGLKANLRLQASLAEIAKGSGLDEKKLGELANQPEKFGLPESVKNLEGWLHPGEYRFALDTSAEKVLTELVDSTKTALQDAGVNDLGEGYRALKVASILQAEATPKDYATVAGAIENRLNPNNVETHGLLQTDSTVIYGLDRYSLQFTATEKRDAGNQYNTYVHTGLPPTPIGSPATSAIDAAVNPADNGFYYWVTVNTQSGETKFASNYAEHQVNQNEFRAWCAANAEVCK